MKRLFTSLLLLALLMTLGGCIGSSRDYREDIVLPLEDRAGVLVIREWSLLLGGGAEIYYRLDGEETQIGRTTGGNDGYCPFAAGRYQLHQEGDTVTLRWHFDGDSWKEDSFRLPTE